MQRHLQQWFPLIFWALLMAVFQLSGNESWRYQTQSIIQGELWRMISGHWVHANWIHFLLNMVGFALCRALTSVEWTLKGWSWRILLLCIGISSLFLLFSPKIGWYVGFSGVLFGLYVLAAVDALNRHRVISVILLLLVGIKIVVDIQSSGKMTSSELIGVPVLVESHLYGAVVAVSIVIIQMTYRLILLKLKRLHE